MIARFACFLCVLIVSTSMLQAAEPVDADFFVSPQGNDAWSGSLAEPNAEKTDGPLATLTAARDAVRRLKAKGPLDKPVRVVLRGGTYRLSEPIIFSAEDSGTADSPITYTAWPGEKPTLSGGVPIAGWKQDGPLWTTVIPEVQAGSWYFRQLFVNGRRATPARTPNESVFRAAGPGVPYTDRNAARKDPNTKTSLFYQNDDLKQWSNRDDAVVVVYHSWTTSRHRIKTLDTEKRRVEFTAPSAWPMGWWEKNERYYVESIREGLDQPGEWYLDRTSGQLSYYPLPGEEMTTTEAIAPVPEELVRLEGDPAADQFVDHLHFEGLSLQHTAWIMPEAASVDGQANASLKTTTVYCLGARNCSFLRCEIAHTGGYALWLQRGCKDNRVEQCHIHDMAAGGVRLGEMSLPDDPDQQAERNEIFNCFIHDGGNVYHAAVGVWIGRSSHNRVHRNDICDFFYTGVSVGWSWGYAPSTAHHNVIESNHIHHLGFGELSDMGGIYCLGIAPGTKLLHNRIHDVMAYSYGGWGLYTDEGSTGVLMENNIVYRVKDGAFHQHYGRDNLVRNNVLALSATYGQIRRSRQEEHNSFTLERNIIYGVDVPMLGGNWSNGNFTLHHNCYFDASGDPKFPGGLTLAAWQEKGHDAHSIIADPKFVSPAESNFRLPPTSPATQIGFKPIDPDTIGLTGPVDWTELPNKYPLPPIVLPGEEEAKDVE